MRAIPRGESSAAQSRRVRPRTTCTDAGNRRENARPCTRSGVRRRRPARRPCSTMRPSRGKTASPRPIFNTARRQRIIRDTPIGSHRQGNSSPDGRRNGPPLHGRHDRRATTTEIGTRFNGNTPAARDSTPCHLLLLIDCSDGTRNAEKQA